jgi:hypothetical protein
MSRLLLRSLVAGVALAATSCDGKPAQESSSVIGELMMQQPVALEDRAQLDAYLDRLESQAREKGRVTALEVEPGMRAIELLAPELGPEASLRLRADFAKRMRALSLRNRGEGGSR